MQDYSLPLIDGVDLLFLDGADGRAYFVDTGTPWTVIVTPGSEFEHGSLTSEEWLETVGIPAGGLEVVSGQPPDGLMEFLLSQDRSGREMGGILGNDFLIATSLRIDLLNSVVTSIGQPTNDPIDLGAELLGAGRTCFTEENCFDYPASRLVVDVEIDGQPLTGLVDTGATDVILTNPGRERLERAAKSPFDGDNVARLLRADGETQAMTIADDVTIGGVPIDSVLIQYVPDDDTARLDRFKIETGRELDVVIGLSFLDNYNLLLSSSPGIQLEPGPPQEPVSDLTGIGIGAPSTDRPYCFEVELVLEGGTPDTLGIEHGDCIASVSGLTPSDIAWDDFVGSMLDYSETLPDGQEGWEVVRLTDSGPETFYFPVETFVRVEG